MTHKEIIPMHKDTYFFGYGIDIEDPIELAHKIIEQDKEIERLNNIINNDDVYGYIKHLEDLTTKKDNIINELESYIIENSFGSPANNCSVIETYKIFDKLQELKESNKKTSEKTSMLKLLNERMEKEDIIKLVCNYDNKFNEIEEENKRLNNIINELEKKFDDVIKDPLIHMCYKRLAREYADKLQELKGSDKK